MSRVAQEPGQGATAGPSRRAPSNPRDDRTGSRAARVGDEAAAAWRLYRKARFGVYAETDPDYLRITKVAFLAGYRAARRQG